MFNNKASIVMSVAATAVVMSAGVGYAAERGVVTADSLNIRSGPSTSYSIKAKVTKGTVVNLGKKSNGWYEVSLANGISGWASGNYIEVVKTTNAQQGEITEATYLRKEAKWTTDKLALIKKGTKVEVISTDVNWTKVSYNNQIGYIANDYIKVTSAPKEEAENTNKNTGKILEATYLRKEAKWTTDKLSLLKKGVKVEVISSDTNWTKVSYNNQIGYVANDYIEVEKASSTPIVPEPVIPDKIIGVGEVVDATYLRKEAKWTTDKILLLQKGTKVDILSKDANWTKVKYENKEGYISNDYIKDFVEDNSNNSPEEDVKEGFGKVIEAVYLRDDAKWSANKLMVIQPNTVVEVLSKDDNWTKVKYQGTVGYIGNAYIESSKTESTEDTNSDRNSKVESVINLAKSQLGKPYEWGAEGPNSYDCSGLMYYIYKNGAGITLPRLSKEQAEIGKRVSFSEIQPGDLISFDFDKDGVVSHVGVYIGNGEFIHALKPGTVIQVTSTSSSYWKNAIYSIQRIIE